ncbi:gag-pol polyprotein [Tanacetum coccineum]
MIQVKEMMQDNDLKSSKSKDKGSRSRSQSMNEQSHYKQDKTKTRQSINVKSHIFNVIGGDVRQEEIKRQFITAYTPQQNEVAEWMDRTLLVRARAMLATASLGKSFWAKVVNTACYVINRSPSTAVELKTPMEMWTEIHRWSMWRGKADKL